MKLRGTMLEFHRQWLEFDRLEREATKDPTLYPTVTTALKNATAAVDQGDYRLALNHAIDSREQAQNAARVAADTRARSGW